MNSKKVAIRAVEICQKEHISPEGAVVLAARELHIPLTPAAKGAT